VSRRKPLPPDDLDPVEEDEGEGKLPPITEEILDHARGLRRKRYNGERHLPRRMKVFF